MTIREVLVKGRTIIASEVLHGYDEKVRELLSSIIKNDKSTSPLSPVCLPPHASTAGTVLAEFFIS